MASFIRTPELSLASSRGSCGRNMPESWMIRIGDKEYSRRQASPRSERTLLTDLAALGIRPDEIDVVINTHLHSDHCGWNTRKVDGKLVPTFENARYMVQREEWEAAVNPNERTRGTYFAENLTPLEEYGRL